MDTPLEIQDELDECSKCGSINVTYGSGYYYDVLAPVLSPTRQDYSVSEVKCLRCGFCIEKTVPIAQTCEAAKALREQWNKLSRERFKPDSDRSFALYRIASALRIEGERLLEKAKEIENEAEMLRRKREKTVKTDRNLFLGASKKAGSRR